MFHKKIINYFFSLPCPGCKQGTIQDKFGFCSACIEKLKLINPPFCPGCGGELDGILDVCSKCLKEQETPWGSAIALMHMKGFGRDLIQRFKYNNDTSLSRPFATLAVNAFEKSGIQFDLISPIPLHWAKSFTRGYNQSALIASQISKITKVKHRKILFRNRKTRSQTKLTGKQRRNNIENAFSLMNVEFIKDKNILLIDDVFTTGSTLRAATNEIIKATPKSVSVLVLARR